jgi:transposase
MDVTPRKRSKIVTLSDYCGKNQREIAKICGVSQGTVCNILKCFRETGTLSPRRRGRCGRKRVTNVRDDRFLLQQSYRDPKKTSLQLKVDLALHHVPVSTRTVRRRLLDAGRPARKPVKKQLLTSVMKKKRLAWAREHKNWKKEDWAKVVFSDETHFEVRGQRTRFVRRSLGEPIRPGHVEQHVKYPDKKMFWGCFSVTGPGTLQPIDGMMNGDKYIDVLERKLVPELQKFPAGDAIFQHDLAPCHTSRKVLKYMRDNKITTLQWPGNSPDINPIENLWAIIKQRLRSRDCTTKTKVIEAVVSIWFHDDEIKKMCQTLVFSMPERVAMVLRSKGGHIKY